MNDVGPAPIRVMIVEDSIVVRLLLEQIVEDDPRLVVAASVESGEKAIEVIERARPDVVSLDIRLPGIDGVETTRRIMTQRPTPIVIVSGHLDSQELDVSMNALKAGALSIVEKPAGVTSSDYLPMASQICRQFVLMSDVRVVRRRGIAGLASTRSRINQGQIRQVRGVRSDAGTIRHRALGIVASTGGPNAIVQLLCELGGAFPLPIFMVQHITDAFHEGFVRWLDGCVPMTVVDAEDGQSATPGNVYVAPAGKHLVVGSHVMHTRDMPPVAGQRPSGTVLFESLESAYGECAIGVLLTGMGSDGAQGLRSMFLAGAHTIAEDESTAVVYGMPKAAVNIGAVRELLPLPRIAPRLQDLAGRALEVS
ncbi:MAG: chemotaxis-specific protein-glutamate methyltransferase CheB [Rhodospirillales bacterium]